MILSFAYCNVAVVPLHSEPAHRSEQVSQLLFGERVQVLTIDEKEWAQVRCEWDDYEGWCRASQLCMISRKEYRKEPRYISTGLADKIQFTDSEMWLPMGCDLKGGKLAVGTEQGVFKGKKQAYKELLADCDHIKITALKYLHAPYLWGGRSVAGIDCSGLSQMVFKLCNKPLPRDASLQAQEGETVDFLQHGRCGDLAFFDNDEGKIVHVGILLDHDTIIHATEMSGRVTIDRIDQGGIISTSLRKRTHKLRLVKRYF
ncbi:MAG: hypothetical protein BGO69_12250 [Bacteroidetes bacterium 46-16]|nr:MAG: hypothetical protein BGO69_12250 [Bacteroidetes bacterium 46-16]